MLLWGGISEKDDRFSEVVKYSCYGDEAFLYEYDSDRKEGRLTIFNVENGVIRGGTRSGGISDSKGIVPLLEYLYSGGGD